MPGLDRRGLLRGAAAAVASIALPTGVVPATIPAVELVVRQNWSDAGSNPIDDIKRMIDSIHGRSVVKPDTVYAPVYYADMLADHVSNLQISDDYIEVRIDG